MIKNLAYRSLYLHYIKGLKINEVANETGLRVTTVRSIVGGVKMPEVANDFFADRKAGTFERTYETVYNKLSQLDYMSTENRYIHLICHDRADITEIRSYLLEDCIEPKQAEKMLRTLTKLYEVKQGELMDNKLKSILNVLAMPSKWVLTATGLQTMYVLPILDEKLNVIGTELKPTRSFVIPDELWSRYITA